MAQTQLTHTLLEGVRSGARSVIWFVRGVMGEDAYEKYLLHYETVHGNRGDEEHDPFEDDHAPAPRPMTEREFWRDHSDRQDNNPQGRCC
jgi:uncharacterized short protein YbdD (DUF466 family)